MKALALYCSSGVGILFFGQLLFGDGQAPVNFRFAAIVGVLLGLASWLRWNWAPEFYRKRQERKNRGLRP